jgi:rhamnose utilization protein RhaD (predicted bifunctional aldolase and dehydrogenase)
MTVRLDASKVPAELVRLTSRLGDPARDLVVLAEGNTSTLVGTDQLAVKASGARMDRAVAADFVLVDLDEAAAVLADPGATQAELTRLLAVESGPHEGRRASIETLLHVAAATTGLASWVAHTHPTAIVGLVSTLEGPALWEGPLFPDEAVVVGTPAWVGYEEPGLALGRAVAGAIRDRLELTGVPPRCVLLGNHGLVALGSSSEEVEAITVMAVKAARTRALALSVGTPAWLDAGLGADLAARGDEVERRLRLTGGRP